MAATSVHGHDILHILFEADPQLTREELVATANERFGAEARYHTCSADGMSIEELIDFLAARGKFVVQEGRMGLVVTFVAILELIKEEFLFVVQNEPFAPIHVRTAA